MVLPSESSCEQPLEPEVELTRPLYGVRPGDALQTAVRQFSKVGPVPVQWSDGMPTTLSMTLEEEPRVVCGGLDALFDTKQAAHFRAPVRLRIKSGDGRVDIVLPVSFVWQVYPEGAADPGGAPSWDASWSLYTESSFQVSALRAAGELRGVDLPSSATIHVDFLAGGPPDRTVARLALKEWGPMCSGEPRPIVAVQTPDSVP